MISKLLFSLLLIVIIVISANAAFEVDRHERWSEKWWLSHLCGVGACANLISLFLIWTD